MMIQCQGTTKVGARCGRHQKKPYCFAHQSQAQPIVDFPHKVQCGGVSDDGERCERTFANGKTRCWEHSVAIVNDDGMERIIAMLEWIESRLKRLEEVVFDDDACADVKVKVDDIKHDLARMSV